MSHFEQQLASQRVSIRMQPVGRQAQDDVADLNVFAGDDLLAIDHPHDEACEIVFAIGVKSRHLGRLAANQRAAVVLAGVSNPFHHLLCNGRIQLPRSQIIHEEHGSRALHGDVVHAMVDQVRAYGRVQLHLKRNLQLGADAVHTGDQYRIGVLGLVD